MTKLADQQALVERNALAVERAHLGVAQARERLLHSAHRRLTSPSTLFLVFSAGLLWGALHHDPAHAGRRMLRVLPTGAHRLLAMGAWVFRRLRRRVDAARSPP